MHKLLVVVVALTSLLACVRGSFTMHDALLIIDVQNDFMEETPIRSIRPEYMIPGELLFVCHADTAHSANLSHTRVCVRCR